MPLLLLAYPFIEIFLIYKFSQAYSFGDYILFTLSTGCAGFLIMSMMGKDIFGQVQTSLAQKQLPAEKIMHKALVMLGGLLIFLPGIVSDIFGALLILPGFRHIAVFYFKFVLTKAISKGSVFVSNMSWNFGGGQHGFGRWQRPLDDEPPPQERDAQVIDIEAIASRHTPKEDEN